MELVHIDPPGCDIALVRRPPLGGGHAKGCVLFLHGLGDASSMYAPALEEESLADYEVALVDLPGHGLSDKPANFDYAPASMAAAVSTLAQRAGLSRPLYVVGFSLGGAVAVELTRFAPLGVGGLVLCEPALEDDRMSFAQLVVARPEQDFVDDYAELLEPFADLAAPEPDRRWAETAAFASARSIWRCSQAALAAARRGELVAHLEEYKGPTTLVLSPDTMDKWARVGRLQAAGARVVRVSSASKMPMYDAPRDFYSAIARAVEAAAPHQSS